MSAATEKAGVLPGHYLLTRTGLYLAVVLAGVVDRPVHASLRYMRRRDGSISKLDTVTAREWLQRHHPSYLSYSDRLGGEAVRVPPADIVSIRDPVETVARIEQSQAGDELKEKAMTVIEFLTEGGVNKHDLGITGSLMLGFHNLRSDIDFIVYDRRSFQLARGIIMETIDGDTIGSLDETMWLEAYKRRGCALDVGEYIRHEKRKYNKFLIGKTKIDIRHVPRRYDGEYTAPVKKLGQTTIEAEVLDDSGVFDYPARYVIDDGEVSEIRCYTATYTGQAFRGEYVRACGMIECDARGNRYMVVGTSREAPGEYIKALGL